MGNCCKLATSMEWRGEDWGYLKPKNTRKMSSNKVFDEGQQGSSLGIAQKEKLFGALRASSDANGKVKIRISKKELAELLGGRSGIEKHDEEQMKKQVGRASAEQVLLRLLKARDHDDAHHRPWKPELESIPEVN